ncbi:MAG: hypothetical protein N2316_11675 [Spirochaetes bacterium]|nr:hypothetical protein [Spirochaetota bacterium]
MKKLRSLPTKSGIRIDRAFILSHYRKEAVMYFFIVAVSIFPFTS